MFHAITWNLNSSHTSVWDVLRN